MKQPQTRISRRIFRSLLIAAGLLLLGALGATQVARAFETDDDGIIAADEVIDDDVLIEHDVVVVDGVVNGNLIVFASRTEINGTVGGDVILSCANVTINGQVRGSVAFAGQKLRLNGTVDGSVFSTGRSVLYSSSASVGRNVFFAGFDLEAEEGSSIGRDLRIAAYQALLAGRVGRHVQAEVSALVIEGSIGGDVVATVDAPESAPPFDFFGLPPGIDSGLRVAEQAQIDGRLTYTSPENQSEGIRCTPGGGVEHRLPEKITVTIDPMHNCFVSRMRDLITMLVLGSLAAWAAPSLLKRPADQLQAHPFLAGGWGIAIFTVLCVGLLLLMGMLTILWFLLIAVGLGDLSTILTGITGSALWLLLILVWLVIAYGAELILAYLVGRLLLRRFAPAPAAKPIWPLLLGLALYMPIRAIPILGLGINIVIAFLGLGAVGMALVRRGRVDSHEVKPAEQAGPADLAPGQ